MAEHESSPARPPEGLAVWSFGRPHRDTPRIADGRERERGQRPGRNDHGRRFQRAGLPASMADASRGGEGRWMTGASEAL